MMAEYLQCYPMELVSLEKQRPAISDEEVCLAAIYHEMGAVPLWVDDSGPTEKAEILLSFLQNSDGEGLHPADYQVNEIVELWNKKSLESLAELDTLLTYNSVKYIHDMSHGELAPFFAYPELFAEAGEQKFDPVATVEQLVEHDDLTNLLRSLPPAHAHYGDLRHMLSLFREKNYPEQWPELFVKKSVRKGDKTKIIGDIRKRLFILTENSVLNEYAEIDLFDENLEKSVLLFQKTHGLKPDGVVGKKTLRELNISPAQRIDQIKVNMARWRWQDHDLGEDYILVNIADYHLYVYEAEKIILELPVIVGKMQHQTPVFSDKITYFEINPFWNIPPSIAMNEELPELRKNPLHLQERNIRVFSSWLKDAVELDSLSINWQEVTRSQMARYKLRQDPGPDNSLGRFKFVFPNHYSVYIHDTPATNLFSEHSRFFSHGCIRVSEPERLARYILEKTGKSWGESHSLSLENGERKVIRVNPPLPIHITYQTAWLDKEGRINFNRDIYNRDTKLYKALSRNGTTAQ